MAAFTENTFVIPNSAVNTAGVVANATTGAVLFSGLFGNKSGEGGAMLADGTTIFGNIVAGAMTSVKIYSPTCTLVTGGIVPSGYDTANWHTSSPMTQAQGQFWVAWLDATLVNFSKIAPVSALGVTGTVQTLDITRCRTLGASTDGTIMYYANATANSPIKAWDLVAHATLGTLVAGEATVIWGFDLLCLPETSSFVVVAEASGGVSPFEVRRYSTAGVLLQTYPLPNSPQVGGNHVRLSIDLGDPTSFWARTFEDATGNTGTIWRFDLATGAVLKQLTVQQDSSDPTKLPKSCPFYAWGASRSGPIVPGGGLTVQYDPIRRQRTAPHLTDGTNRNRLFYPGAQLLFEPGGPRDDVGPLYFDLEWSDNGGATWSNIHRISAGELGQYGWRAIWRRLGTGRDRVFRVTESNAAKIVWTDFLLDPDPESGTS